jgi:hypothetical protein
MNDEIRKAIMSSFYFYSDMFGWTYPIDVGARIETESGCHIWKCNKKAEELALAVIYYNLLEKCSEFDLSNKALDAKLKFEIFHKIENLISFAEIIYEEIKK